MVTAAVISTTSTMPVSGARTTPVKKAAIPTTANAAGWIFKPGNASWPRSPKNSPSCAPSTSMGANKPPGVPAAYDTAPSPKRRANRTGRRASDSAPASVRWVMASPPPTSAGANHARAPTAAPISAARSSTGQRPSRSAAAMVASSVRL